MTTNTTRQAHGLKASQSVLPLHAQGGIFGGPAAHPTQRGQLQYGHLYGRTFASTGMERHHYQTTHVSKSTTG